MAAEEEDGSELDTLPGMSHNSSHLAGLHGEWTSLLRARDAALSPVAFAEAARDLARRVVEHRAELFAVDAALQVEQDVTRKPWSDQLAANEDAVKFCTTMLNEMTAALGMTSLPKRELG